MLEAFLLCKNSLFFLCGCVAYFAWAGAVLWLGVCFQEDKKTWMKFSKNVQVL